MKKSLITNNKFSIRKMPLFLSVVCVMSLLACTGCGKDEGSGGGGTHGLTGTIFTHFAGEVSVYNLTENKFTEKVARVSASNLLKSYDISWDGKEVLFTGGKKSTYDFDHRRVIYRDINLSVNSNDVLNDGKNIHDFYYEWGDLKDLDAFISPNKQYIALQGIPSSDMPTIVIRADRDVELGRCNPSGVGYHLWGKPVWAADNLSLIHI